MNENHLTQEAIDAGSKGDADENNSLYAKAGSHPLFVGGAVLVGAGLAYAAAKVISKSLEDEVARDVHLETRFAFDKSPEALYCFWRELSRTHQGIRRYDAREQ